MKRFATVIGFVIALPFMLGANECDPAPAQSASGVQKATASVQTGSDGLTAEQRNIRERLQEDNKPGAIKHLYVISAYSGQVLIYSTVAGKVTSSGKRLTPSHVTHWGKSASQGELFSIRFSDGNRLTTEVLGDDGAYGSSIPYIYWKDTKGAYHQHYVEGGQIVHVSDAPLAVKSIVINMAATDDK